MSSVVALMMNAVNFSGDIGKRREFLGAAEVAALRKVSQGRALEQEPLLKSAIEGANALCIGCGEGAELLVLHQLGARKVVGIDLSPDMVEAARQTIQNVEGVEVHLGDGERLPFPDQHFDFILCSEVIEHVLDPEQFLLEVKRLLTPAGVLYLTFPSFCSIKGPHLWHILRIPFAQHLFGLQAMRSAAAMRLQEQLGREVSSWEHLNRISLRRMRKLIKRIGDLGIVDLKVYTPFLLLKPLTLAPFLDDLAGDSIRFMIKKGDKGTGYLSHKVRQWSETLSRALRSLHSVIRPSAK